jgi:hypothetical protein
MSPTIVAIPGMPGEKIDSRILPDVLAIMRKYKVKVTDGYSTSSVHAAGGEHPLGLAVDLVPDTARGGTWADVDRLAKWAEPRQNAPQSPFRWVGYTGDPNHGKGDHLHLSWLRTGATVATARGNVPDNNGGDGGGPSVLGTVAGVVGGPAGMLAGTTGLVDKAAGVATDVAGTAAKALLNVLWDAFGEDGARIVLYIALVLGGATLTVIGLTRALGVGAPNPLKAAALATPAGRTAKAVT